MVDIDGPRHLAPLKVALALAAFAGAGAGCALAAQPVVRPLPPNNLERGIGLYREAAFESSARVLEQATKDFPEEPTAWLYLGLARLQIGDHRGAAEPFERTLALDPSSAEAHYGLGVVHMRSGRFAPAAVSLSRAVAINPTHAYAHYYLGLAYDELEEADETLIHLQLFVSLRPDAPEAARAESLIYRLR